MEKGKVRRPLSPLAEIRDPLLLNSDNKRGLAHSDDVLDCIRRIKWEHATARALLEEGVTMFSYPTYIATQKGGLAGWSRQALEGTPFVNVEVFDNPSTTSMPQKTKCFWKVGVKYDLQKDCRNKVFDLGDALSYDYQRKVLSVTGKNHDWCCVILLVATSVGNCMMDASLVQRENIIEKVMKPIENDRTKLTALVKELGKMLLHSPGNIVVE